MQILPQRVTVMVRSWKGHTHEREAYTRRLSIGSWRGDERELSGI
jgi:hypothetical protein